MAVEPSAVTDNDRESPASQPGGADRSLLKICWSF